MIANVKRVEKEGDEQKRDWEGHDEWVFDAYKDKVDIINPGIKEEMENAVKLDGPLDVEIGIGQNWLEAHQSQTSC